jgi:DNA-binding FadR family transcriptional regulator
MARYHEIADDLRARIKAGEWDIGDKLPGIAALQEHYQVEKSLGTIRSAQQLLVTDGMLRTEQGVGAFVTATKPIRPAADIGALLAEIRDLANDALVAAQRDRIAAKGKVTFDLMADDDSHFVLDTALQEFAARVRSEAEDAEDAENQDDAESSSGVAESRRRWAQAAERMREEIDAALG